MGGWQSVELVLCKLLQRSQLGADPNPADPALRTGHPRACQHSTGTRDVPQTPWGTSLELPVLPLPLSATPARTCPCKLQHQAPNVPLGRARHLHLTTEEGILSLQPERLGNIRRKKWVGELKGPVGGCRKSVTLI